MWCFIRYSWPCPFAADFGSDRWKLFFLLLEARTRHDMLFFVYTNERSGRVCAAAHGPENLQLKGSQNRPDTQCTVPALACTLLSLLILDSLSLYLCLSVSCACGRSSSPSASCLAWTFCWNLPTESRSIGGHSVHAVRRRPRDLPVHVALSHVRALEGEALLRTERVRPGHLHPGHPQETRWHEEAQPEQHHAVVYRETGGRGENLVGQI